MTLYSLLLLLELFGLSIAIYLIWSRKRNEEVICVIGKGCKQVLESKYNKIFGPHNDIMGALYYSSMIVLGLFLRYDLPLEGLWLWILQAMAITGIAMGVLLLYLQWKVIEAWCSWCIVSNFNTFLIAFIILQNS